ncbi:MAG: hypothetical protein OEO21_02985 [Candidatus Krumholzibacteria bacterium]|nr:hypothetical protein [Candidatus Krumholzibacteria bacterium]
MAKSYYELIIRGDDKRLLAYVEGFMRGKGVRSGYFFTSGLPVDIGHLRERVKYHGEVVHVLCEAPLRAAVESAVKQASESFGFDVVETRKLKGAGFRFECSTANRKVAGELKRALARLPEGVRLADYEPEEIVDKDAAVVEVYSPAHPYEFRAKGAVTGDVAGVLRVRAKLGENEFFRCQDVTLHH